MMFTDFAVGFGMTYVYLPLMVLPVYASIEKLDFRLVEGAYDLYASRWLCLRRIIVPLVRPGLIAGSILVFIPCLGAYVTPQILGGGNQLMFGNLIALQFGQGKNWPLGAALSITLMVIVRWQRRHRRTMRKLKQRRACQILRSCVSTLK